MHIYIYGQVPGDLSYAYIYIYMFTYIGVSFFGVLLGVGLTHILDLPGPWKSRPLAQFETNINIGKQTLFRPGPWKVEVYRIIYYVCHIYNYLYGCGS